MLFLIAKGIDLERGPNDCRAGGAIAADGRVFLAGTNRIAMVDPATGAIIADANITQTSRIVNLVVIGNDLYAAGQMNNQNLTVGFIVLPSIQSNGMGFLVKFTTTANSITRVLATWIGIESWASELTSMHAAPIPAYPNGLIVTIQVSGQRVKMGTGYEGPQLTTENRNSTYMYWVSL